MRHGAGARTIFWPPLVCAGWTLRKLPLIAEQILEVVVAPLRRRSSPRDLQAAGGCVRAFARAEAVFPTETQLIERGGFRIRPHIGGRARAVGLAERMPARD